MDDESGGATPPPPEPLSPEPATSAYEAVYAPSRRSGGKVTAIAVTVAVLLAVGATAVLVRRSTDEGVALERFAPGDVFVFAKVSVRPSLDQRRALRRVLDRFPDRAERALTSKIEDLLDEATREVGLDYERDVKPWVGNELAIAARQREDAPGGEESQGFPQPEVVGMIAVADAGAARAALGKAARNEDEFAFEVDGDVAFVSDRPERISGFRAAAARGDLAGEAGYDRRLSQLGGDGLALVYFNGERLTGFLGAAAAASGVPGLPPGLGGTFRSSAVAVLRAADAGIEIVGRQDIPEGIDAKAGRPRLVEGVPAGILGALTFFDPGTAVRAFLDNLGIAFGGFESRGGTPGGTQTGRFDPKKQVEAFLRQALGLDLEDDVYPWLRGELSIIVGGISANPTAPVDAGALIEVTNEGAARRTIDALRARLGPLLREAPLAIDPAPGGFDLEFEDGFRLLVRRERGRVVVATSAQFADRLLGGARETLAEDEIYRRVLGPSGNVTFQAFVRVDRIRDLVEVFLPALVRSAYENDIAPFLRPVEAISVRATEEGGESVVRILFSVP